MDLIAILTCFNRKEKTILALKSLVEKNSTINFHFIVVDDNSTDGTSEAIQKLHYDVEIIRGNGHLYWCGGMRAGIARYLERERMQDCLLINDDVEFYDHSIEKMVLQLANRQNIVVVGATQNKNQEFTYGLRKRVRGVGIRLLEIAPCKKEIHGDTMNANCVLIPHIIMKRIGNIDSHYTHSLGDYDLGFRIKRMGYFLVSSREYVGTCEDNEQAGTWRNPLLPRRQRLKMKDSPKGLPFREWWHYLYINYGISRAILHSIIPYIRIMLKK